MEGLNLISTFAEFKELKNIDRPTMMSVLEDIFRTQLAKMYGTADNFDIIINIDKGDFEIWRNRTVVETVEDPNTEISKEEVDKIDNSYEIGEEFTEEVKLASFGRRGILNLRQNLSGRIMDIEKANLFNAYRDRIGEIMVGEVYQAWKKEVLGIATWPTWWSLRRTCPDSGSWAAGSFPMRCLAPHKISKATALT